MIILSDMWSQQTSLEKLFYVHATCGMVDESGMCSMKYSTISFGSGMHQLSTFGNAFTYGRGYVKVEGPLT